MSIPKLGSLVSVPLREAWKHEAGEFTPWLAEESNLESLAAALGLSELELVATEHKVGDFKLDILCTNGDENVVIENQLAETDHKHLGQILAYAAGVGAKTVIWVTESFRPEHAAALQFLNENTTEDLSFFGVKIELWQIGTSPFAPKFEVVVKPNDWVKVGREQVRTAASSSPTKQLQFKFWTALVEYLSINAPKIRPQKPRFQHWLVNTIGKSGFNLNVVSNISKRRIGIELWITGQSAKSRFYALQAEKDDIENSLGYQIEWQELPDSIACRIVSWIQDAPLEDEERWQEYIQLVTNRLQKMDYVFRDRVKIL